MKRILGLILSSILCIMNCTVYADTWKSYICHSDVYSELVQYAKLSTNLKTQKYSSLEYIRNRLFESYCPDSAFEAIGTNEQGYIEFDFLDKRIDFSYMVMYLTKESNVNYSNVSLKGFKNGAWITLGMNILSTSSSYVKQLKSKSVQNISKLRLCFDNVKDKSFSVSEITLYGNIAGYSDVTEIKSVFPHYARVKVNETVPKIREVSVLKPDGDLGIIYVDYDLPEIFTEEGLYLYKKEIPYFSGVYAKILIDVYDDKKDMPEAFNKALANGLVGGIQNKENVSGAEAAKILFRKFNLEPDCSGETAEEIIQNTLKNAGISFNFNESITYSQATEWIFTLSGEEIKTDKAGYITTEEFILMLDNVKTAKTTRYFGDNNSVLQNPDRGLFSYYVDSGGISYDSLNGFSEYYEDLEGLSVLYVRIPWALLNPFEDIYDFSLIDSLIEKYAPYKKQIGLRITSMEGYEYTAPKWVYDNGAKYKKWAYTVPRGQYENYNTDSSMKYFAPDYEDEVFLHYEEKFFNEIGRKYNNNKNIAFVDMGIGLWGEGHVGGRMEYYSKESYIRRMEMLRTAFPDKPLVIINETEKGMGYDEEKWIEVLQKAKELNFGYRNDTFYGVIGALSDSMWLPDEKDDALELSDFGPVIMELDHYYSSSEEKYLGKPNLYDDLGTGAMIIPQRASYLGIHGPVRQFYEECSEFIDYCNLNLGYRIYPEKVMVSDTVQTGERIEVLIDWKNTGAAKCMKDYYPALTLVDENKDIVLVLTDADFSSKTIPIAEIVGNAALIQRTLRKEVKPLTEKASFKINDSVQKGEYDVYLSMGTAYGEPVLQMPLADEWNGRYYIGKITVK